MDKNTRESTNIVPAAFESLTATQKSWRGLGSEAKARKNAIAKSAMYATIFFMSMQWILKNLFEEGATNLQLQWSAVLAGAIFFFYGLALRIDCLFIAEESLKCRNFEVVIY